MRTPVYSLAMKLCIAGVSFTTKKKAKIHLQSLLGSLVGCEIRESSPNYKTLYGLWTRSMQYVPNVKSFVVIRKFSGAGIRSITDSGFIDWSVNAALSGNCVTHWTMLTAALRTSIRPQIREFKTRSEGICAICKRNYLFLEADHVLRFAKLMREFVAQRSDVPTEFSYDLSGWRFRDEHLQFETDWLAYHLANARLRLLCPPCHSKHTISQRLETEDN